MNLKELIEYARDHNIIEYGNYVDLINRVDELYETEDNYEDQDDVDAMWEDIVEDLKEENYDLKDSLELATKELVNFYEIDKDKCYICNVEVGDCSKENAGPLLSRVRDFFKKLGFDKLIYVAVYKGIPSVRLGEILSINGANWSKEDIDEIIWKENDGE